MFKEKGKVSIVNKILIVMLAIICVFAVLLISLTQLNKKSVETHVKETQGMIQNYATTAENTWDVSKNGDGSVTATLSSDGTLTISGTGNMKDWEYQVETDWHNFDIKGKVKKVVINKGVTSIGSNAFTTCGRLTSIEIPSGVLSIGSDAFSFCDSLTSIVIPKGVTSIGDNAFERCSNLTSIKIPEGVTTIGEKAFYDCSSLTSITIPGGVTSIGWATFWGCSSLTSITIPEGVTIIDDYAFVECSSLTSITIPDSVTEIGGEAFNGCDSLTSITIPEGVTSIGQNTFYGCCSLKIINIPSGVTDIKPDAFRSCRDLKIICSSNSVAETYAKENGISYQIDDKAPTITFGTNGKSTVSKMQSTTVKVTDLTAGVNENYLKYMWTIVPEDIVKDQIVNSFQNGETLNIKDVTGIHYLWIYSKDKVGNENIVRSEAFVIDNTPPIAEVSYSTTELTKENVKVTITANEEIQAIEGWSLSTDKKILTKEFSENTTKTITVKDIAGNETQVEVKISNIDKIAPTAIVSYSTTEPTKENVTVTITADEEVQGIDGWTLSQDKKILTKEYSENTTEIITVKDIAGNETQVNISITNIIDRTAPTTNVNYSTISKTNQNVKVTITANEEVQAIEGWTLSQDKKILTKEYSENTTETITIKDIAENEVQVNISITNIDRIAPEAEISYSTTNPTKENVKVTITANEEVQVIEGWMLSQEKNILTKEYTQNRTESIIVKDIAGNETQVNISIRNIDRIAPEVQISYSTTAPTKENVTVKIKSDEAVQAVESWTLSTDKKVLTKEYAENTTETVTIKDIAGNETQVNILITNIDRIAPEVQISYSITNLTKEDVTVTITADEEVQDVEGWTLSANKKVLTKEYSENKTETITIKDMLGNEIQQTIEITNIDRIAPEAEISYSTTNPTKENVKVTITANEEVQVIEGWMLSQEKNILTKEYTQNRTESIIVKDIAGNETQVNISIRNIDRIAPTANVSYSTTAPTKENVTVKITADEAVQAVESWTLSTDKKVLTKEYAENTTETVTIKDIAGNERHVEVKISNIDKAAPIVKIEYIQESNEKVKVRITANEEIQELSGWTLKTDKKVLTKEYTQNTTETITIKDIAGNETYVQIKVRGIIKIKEGTYEIKENYIIDINPKTTYENFVKNIETSEYKITENGKEITGKTLIKTGQKLTIGNQTFTLVVIGDTNGDGQANIKDILSINKHRLNKAQLVNEYLQAGDINEDGKVNLRDILQINKYRLGKISEL
mgnify:CR=1 FL=1